MLRRGAQHHPFRLDGDKFIGLAGQQFLDAGGNDLAIRGKCPHAFAGLKLADRRLGAIGAQDKRIRQETTLVMDDHARRAIGPAWRHQQIPARSGRRNPADAGDGRRMAFPAIPKLKRIANPQKCRLAETSRRGLKQMGCRCPQGLAADRDLKDLGGINPVQCLDPSGCAGGRAIHAVARPQFLQRLPACRRQHRRRPVQTTAAAATPGQRRQPKRHQQPQQLAFEHQNFHGQQAAAIKPPSTAAATTMLMPRMQAATTRPK